MNPLDYLKTLEHHAYFLHSFKDGVSNLKDYLKKKFKISHEQNPDLFHEKYDVLTIDESRKIKEFHASRSFIPGNKRIFIIEAHGITHEAQNSLLKIFEEPNEDTHFFLIMPSASVLLPTLRSRLQILGGQEQTEESDVITEAKKFLKLSSKERVDFVDDLAKRISDEEAQKNDAMEFLAALEMIISKKGVLGNEKAIKAILKARDYLNDRSPSVKQLLEFVALSL